MFSPLTDAGRSHLADARERRRQRHPHRRRPQRPPRPRLAEDSFAPDPGRPMAPAHNPFRAQIGFLTDDYRSISLRQRDGC